MSSSSGEPVLLLSSSLFSISVDSSSFLGKWSSFDSLVVASGSASTSNAFTSVTDSSEEDSSEEDSLSSKGRTSIVRTLKIV